MPSRYASFPVPALNHHISLACLTLAEFCSKHAPKPPENKADLITILADNSDDKLVTRLEIVSLFPPNSKNALANGCKSYRLRCMRDNALSTIVIHNCGALVRELFLTFSAPQQTTTSKTRTRRSLAAAPAACGRLRTSTGHHGRREVLLEPERATQPEARPSLPLAAHGRAEYQDEVGLVWVEPAPGLLVGEVAELARINGVEAERRAGYWFGRRGADGKAGQKADPDEKVIYSCHGGGYILGSGRPSFASGYICREILKYAKDYGRVFQIDYRLSSSSPLPPSGPFPAALVDALAGYKYLVQDLGFQPHNIIVMGESAGGHLAFALTRYLAQENLPGLPSPRGQLLLSPSFDWGFTQMGLGSSHHENRHNDMVHSFYAGYSTRSLLGNLPPEAAWENSWISPGSLRLPHPDSLFKGIPPTCMIVGGVEMSADAMCMLRDRIRADNEEDILVYLELPLGTHVLMTHFWHEPERTQGYEFSASWLATLN